MYYITAEQIFCQTLKIRRNFNLKHEFVFPQEIAHKDCKSSRDGRSLMSCLGSTFTYGYKGMAKYQLKSLAALSSVALQSVQYDCKRGSSAMRAIGWNGAEISVRESEWKLMQNVEVEHNCEVSIRDGNGTDVYAVSRCCV